MTYCLPETILGELMRPERLSGLSTEYQNNSPFPHIVLDGIFNPSMLREVVRRYPTRYDLKWWKYDNILERKLARDDLRELHSSIRYLVYELMERRFVQFLECLTSIEGLIVDHTLNGGGLHQIVRGGKLDIHADYNYHPITRLDRRLNVLLYLNENWEPAWNGNLELWAPDMSRCVKSIEPKFNRMVVFSTTDTAYHGHPEPLNCPEHESRKSIALYYYTHGRPVYEKSEPHSTIFKRRPQDPLVEEFEELRRKRAEKRFT